MDTSASPPEEPEHDVEFAAFCVSVGDALEMLAVGFLKSLRGTILFDPAYPDPMPDIPFTGAGESNWELEDDAPSAVDATAVPGIDFLQLTLRELGLAAADLVYATASLLKRGTFGYSPYTTGRSAIEAMAVMYWLLDPDIDGPSRVERAITEYLDSVRYEPTKRQRSFVTALEQLEGIELNIERAKKSPGKPFYVGLPMPSRTKLVADLSRGYKELSAMAHVGPLGRRAATRRIPLEGGTRTEIRGDKDMLLGLFEAVRVASRLTLDRLAGYTHWSREAFDEAERRALKILSDAAL